MAQPSQAKNPYGRGSFTTTHNDSKLWMDAILLLGMCPVVLFFFSGIGSSKLNKNVFWYEFSFVMFSHWSDAEYWILHIIAVLWVCHFTKKPKRLKKKASPHFPQFFWHKTNYFNLGTWTCARSFSGIKSSSPARGKTSATEVKTNMAKTYPFFPWAKRTHMNIDLPVFIFLLIVTLVLVYQIYNRMHLDLTWKNYRSFSPLESQVTNVYTCHHL